jgi:hypothetical protein
MKHQKTGLSYKLVVLLLAVFASPGISAQDRAEGESPESEALNGRPMTAERLGELILNIDDTATLESTSWHFNVSGLDAVAIYDVYADRMRIVIPIGRVDELEEGELPRLMQANFDSALDARYAIAQGLLWGTYIHPLSTLTDEEFLVGVGQTANIVFTYGTSYSSGLFMFNGGDSVEIERKKLIEELKKRTT